VLQRFLGHDDIASTVRYRHVFNEDIAAAMEAETKTRQEVPQIVLQLVKKSG
jgi:site-specific recombinase XerD